MTIKTPPSACSARGRPDGIGRASSRAAERVSDDLRRGAGPALRRRRTAAAAMLGASASMGVVALYQFGLLRHLPDPPGAAFDSDRVDAPGEAYHSGRTPDTTLALASYGVTLALIGMGGEDRAHRHPWMPLLQAAKVGMDTASAALLTVEQVSKHRALCFCACSAPVPPWSPCRRPCPRPAWRCGASWGAERTHMNRITDGIRRLTRPPVAREEQAVRAEVDGVVIAQSDRTVVVEGNHYFPPEDVSGEHLIASSHRTLCPWKGMARYYDVVVDGARQEKAAWQYRDPSRAAEALRGRIAFRRGVHVVPAH